MSSGQEWNNDSGSRRGEPGYIISSRTLRVGEHQAGRRRLCITHQPRESLVCTHSGLRSDQTILETSKAEPRWMIALHDAERSH